MLRRAAVGPVFESPVEVASDVAGEAAFDLSGACLRRCGGRCSAVAVEPIAGGDLATVGRDRRHAGFDQDLQAVAVLVDLKLLP
jgi:hypothetical protein